MRHQQRAGLTDHAPDASPSEDALFMLIDDLIRLGQHFVVIQPDDDALAWFTFAAILDKGGYEVVRRDTTRREHDVVTERPALMGSPATSRLGLRHRDFPGRLTSTPATSKTRRRCPCPRSA
jgi:hypothetical protein